MDLRYIAAIEIGSSKIKGVIAQVDSNRIIKPLAVEQTDSGDSIRYGRVQNAREVSVRVNDILRRLENNTAILPGHITSVYVSIGGRSVSSVNEAEIISLSGDTEITQDILNKLADSVKAKAGATRDVINVAPQRFMVNNIEVKKVVGAYGSVVKGEYTIVTASPDNRRNLDRVKIELRDKEVPRTYISRPIATALMALTDSERQLGAALIDFGAETTTIVVHRNNALQFVATLPMGSSNITRDLSVGLGLTIEAAEQVKINKGEAVLDRTKYPADDAQKRDIVNFVSARVGEIIANINASFDSAGIKASDLAGGIIITGGGTLLPGFDKMLESLTKVKVRHAEIPADIASGSLSPDCDLDILALVKYAESLNQTNCLTYPAADSEEQKSASGEQGSEQSGSTDDNRPIAVEPHVPQHGRRANAPSIDDKDLLKDDLDYVPRNVNEDNGDELPPEGKNANETRKSLLARIRDYFAPTEADLDDEE